MIEHVPSWWPMAGYALGFAMGATSGVRFSFYREFLRRCRMPRDRDPDWRRSFNHENTNTPSGPPPLRPRRSGDPGSLRPTTPKPDIIPKPQGPRGRRIPPL